MNDKKAADILLQLLKNDQLSVEEKEALGVAIGILGWTSLVMSRTKAKKEKTENSTKW